MRFSASGTGLCFVAMLAAAVAAAGLFVGCTPNQGIGERCSGSNGNDDCMSGLLCRGNVCCPSNDNTCGPTGVATTDSGDEAAPLTDSMDNDTGTDSALVAADADAYDSACTFTTDCPVGLVCHSGHCLVECLGDRDCENGKGCECTGHSCTAAAFSSEHKCGDAGLADAPAETTVDADADAAD